MSIYSQDTKPRDPRYHRGDRSSANIESRKTEFTEDQYIV